mmetsp:Transcript_395/g.1737  ORF Transcript_395/g.1737 Transcript_395/m.1737 type:complete len:212 (-) Transcript_395:60-695(-)
MSLARSSSHLRSSSDQCSAKFGTSTPSSTGAMRCDGKLTVLADFAGHSRRSRPSIRALREILGIFQLHYPERLGSAYLINPPLHISLLWRSLSYFVTAETHQKVRIISGSPRRLREALAAEAFSDVADADGLEQALGGNNDAPFVSSVFLNVASAKGCIYGAEFDEQIAVVSPTSRLELCGKVGEDEKLAKAQAFGWELYFGGGSSEGALW